MSETLRELENRWHLLMAATNPKTGQRVADANIVYAAECAKLRVRIEELRKAETSHPTISPDQLAWLDRLGAARDANGKRLADDMSGAGSRFRERIFKARVKAMEGNLTQAEMESLRTDVQRAGAHSYPEVHADPVAVQRERTANANEGGLRMLPPSSFNAATSTAAQPTHTFLGGPGRE